MHVLPVFYFHLITVIEKYVLQHWNVTCLPAQCENSLLLLNQAWSLDCTGVSKCYCTKLNLDGKAVCGIQDTPDCGLSWGAANLFMA